jgi:hypothetical protein
MVRLPSGFTPPEPGAPVRLHAEHVHRFDADTGLRRSS